MNQPADIGMSDSDRKAIAPSVNEAVACTAHSVFPAADADDDAPTAWILRAASA
jgi:hypothetical protein